MQNSKITKKSMVFSFVSLFILSMTLVLGASLGSFLDKDSNSGNTIHVGELKAELYNTTEGDKSTFFDGSNLWRPGSKETKELLVKNSGNLDFVYYITFDGIKDNTTNNMLKLFEVYVDDVYRGTLENYTGNNILHANTLKAGVETATYDTFELSILFVAEAEQNIEYTSIAFDIILNAIQIDNADSVVPFVAPIKPEAINKIIADDATVTIPKNTFPEEMSGKPMVFTAVMTEIAASEEESKVAQFDVDLKIDEEEIHEFSKAITVTTKIAIGLPNFVVVCENEEAGHNQVHKHSYNPVTGELAFETTHFSSFNVVKRNKEIYNFEFENGNVGDYQQFFSVYAGEVTANTDGTINIPTASNGSYVRLRDYLPWTTDGFTAAAKIYIDPVRQNNFGVGQTLATTADQYATERRIAFAHPVVNKITDTTVFEVKPAHVDVENTPIRLTAADAGWYTVGQSFYDNDGQLNCTMFIIAEDGTEVARWTHRNLAKVNMPSYPNFDGRSENIGYAGSLWIFGSANTLKVDSVTLSKGKIA